MPRVTFLPSHRTLQVRQGTTILSASRKAGVVIRSRCDGVASCLQCKVHILTPDAVSPMNDNERRKLTGTLDRGVRLACQTLVQRDLSVEIPEDPLKAAVRRQLELQKGDQQSLW